MPRSLLMPPFVPIVFVVPALLLGLAACDSMKHDVAAPVAGNVSVCTLCYTEIEKVRISTPRGPDRVATRRTHVCDECKTEATIYATEDGTLMIRCAKCAPDGVACDRCTPAEK